METVVILAAGIGLFILGMGIERLRGSRRMPARDARGRFVRGGR